MESPVLFDEYQGDFTRTTVLKRKSVKSSTIKKEAGFLEVACSLNVFDNDQCVDNAFRSKLGQQIERDQFKVNPTSNSNLLSLPNITKEKSNNSNSHKTFDRRTYNIFLKSENDLHNFESKPRSHTNFDKHTSIQEIKNLALTHKSRQKPNTGVMYINELWNTKNCKELIKRTGALEQKKRMNISKTPQKLRFESRKSEIKEESEDSIDLRLSVQNSDEENRPIYSQAVCMKDASIELLMHTYTTDDETPAATNNQEKDLKKKIMVSNLIKTDASKNLSANTTPNMKLEITKSISDNIGVILQISRYLSCSNNFYRLEKELIETQNL